MNNIKQIIKSNLITFAILLAGILCVFVFVLIKNILNQGGVLGVQYSHSSGALPVVSAERISYQKGSGQQLRYSLSLDRNPGESVKVGIFSANSKSIYFDNNFKTTFLELKFDQSNWNLPQEINLYPSEDIAKGRYTIRNSLNQDVLVEVSVTTPGIIFNPTFSQSEYKKNNSITYAISLSQNPYKNYRISIDTANDIFYFDDAKTKQNHELIFNPQNWDIPQYIKVYYEQDSLPGYKNIKHQTQDLETYFYSFQITYVKPVFEFDSNLIQSGISEYQYRISLDSEPIEPVTIHIKTPSDSGLFLDPERNLTQISITFDSTDWTNKKEVRIYTKDPTIGQVYRIENDILGTKYFHDVQIDGIYPILTKENITINNSDIYRVEYSVRLSKRPKNDQQIKVDFSNLQNYSFEDGTKAENLILNFNEYNWSTFQNIVLNLDSPSYGEYEIKHEVVDLSGSLRSLKISVQGPELVFENGKTFSSELKSGFVDVKVKLNNVPNSNVRVNVSIADDSSIFFNSDLTQQSAELEFNHENWNEDQSFRVYYDIENLKPFEYYELNLELNHNVKTIRIYPYL